MDSNPLCSLSHTTPNTHTNLHVISPTPLTAVDGDDVTEDVDDDLLLLDTGSGHQNPMDEALKTRIQQEFNFLEFYSLTTRVIDNGGRASMDVLLQLKSRWIEKFGDNGSHNPSTSVHDGFCPVSSHQLTPYRLPPPILRSARRIPCLPTIE
ncbi:UNVERIFIED_CONTAM: hypothetical protein Slati_1357100 [Sesamum latifolium]|uniref:Uncharacterized protein n=1 Tax=Sesamum latifolium TaxID=2727402 RepID=A0AAW2XI27_9LAMI